MAAEILQKKSYVHNSPVAATTITLDQPTTADSELIIIYAGDAYVSAGNIPAGFAEPSGARQERYLGHYVWHKTAAAGEQTFTITPNSSCSHIVTVFEVAGLSGEGSMLFSAGQGSGPAGSSSVYATPSVVMSAGERFAIASVGGTSTQSFSGYSAWSNEYTEEFDLFTSVTPGGTNDSLGVATRDIIANANDLTSTTATWTGIISPESRTSIILVFNVGSPDTTPPSAPANVRITRRRATSLTVAWDGSTDNVGVKGYDVFVSGISAGKTTALNFKITGLTADVQYTIAVYAYDTADNYSASSTIATMRTLDGSGKYYWTGATKQQLDQRTIDPATYYATLPRVPWEGGPAYYSQFPDMANTEWTSDAFFPIGYWGAYADQESHIAKYSSLGINTLWTTYANGPETAGWIRAAGLWNMGGALTGSGSEHVGYVVEDEVDMWGGAGWGDWTGATGFVPNVCASGGADCGYTIMHDTEAALPQDGKLRWTNIGMTIFTHLRGAGSAYVNGVTPDGSWPMHLVTTDMYFYTGSGAIVVDSEVNFGTAAEAVRRAGNYGEILMTRMRDYDAQEGARKPLGVVVELGGQIPDGEEMNSDKVEGAVWSTIIHEARCVSYFSHAFVDSTDNPWTSNALNALDGMYPSIQARVGQINTQITQLAPVLNTQSYQWQGSEDIVCMMKIKDGYAYFFTMAKVAVLHSTAPRTFVLPFGISGETAEVLYENRSVEVRAGAIHDTYEAEYTHHIYKIAL